MRSASLLLTFVACAVASHASVLATEPVAVGDEAPNIRAVSLDGSQVTLKSFSEAKLVVVCFTRNGCPFAQAYEQRFDEFAEEFEPQGVEFVAINCDFEEIQKGAVKVASDRELKYTYLIDESGQSAEDYGASVTPHLFILDNDRKVAYTGPFDDNIKQPKAHFVRDAVESLLGGRTPAVTSERPFGCRIKLRRR